MSINFSFFYKLPNCWKYLHCSDATNWWIIKLLILFLSFELSISCDFWKCKARSCSHFAKARLFESKKERKILTVNPVRRTAKEDLYCDTKTSLIRMWSLGFNLHTTSDFCWRNISGWLRILEPYSEVWKTVQTPNMVWVLTFSSFWLSWFNDHQTIYLRHYINDQNDSSKSTVLGVNWMRHFGWRDSEVTMLISNGGLFMWVNYVLLTSLCVHGASDLRNRLRHFETLHKSSLSHNIVKRGLDSSR